jgi:hypothetical protein
MAHYFPNISSRNQAISVFIRDSALHRSGAYLLQGRKFLARKRYLASECGWQSGS